MDENLEYLRLQGLSYVDRALLQRWDESMQNPQARKDFTKLLRKIPLFAEAPDSFLLTLPEAGVPAEFSAGQVVYRQDAQQDWMAIILSGRVSRRLQREGNQEMTIGDAGPGKTCGDLGMLGVSATRTFTATATEACSILQITKAAWDCLVNLRGGVDVYPLVWQARSMQNLLGNKDDFCDLKCFEKLERDFVLALCNELEPRLMYPGMCMMKEGEIGHEMFIVHAGLVDVEKGGRILASLGGGVVLGELAVLGSDKRRTATVRVKEVTLVYVLNGEVVQQTLEQFPNSKRIYDHEYIGRLLKFEMEKVKDEITRLDEFYGRAHPMPSKEVRRDILGHFDEEEPNRPPAITSG
eukprot:TRINITY_DN73724_c0_g1_i1.p1 TRINITY_DN73724_c0_g1~~TRINITY_DN73724_c0_g1_i1.p1  ORF type:complete len:353 (-),score=54.42 TRINITY_DN73724_c0_g1_i1:22-1080(-)